ncbi:MAG TPA: histidine kinase dimerization/phosphoacceptor domain -containing protein, partial [Rhizobacter sp.]|nr:histidine kinase dimerization/phosphoacceptor domain -containing protein [Rhizobacter sp.]
PSGELRVVRARALMVTGHAGQTTRVVGVNWDITEAQATEARMKELLALQTAILSSAAVSIIATDLDGTILSFNRAAQQMLGYSADEMIGHQTMAILHKPAEVAARADILSTALGRSVAPGFEVFVAKPRQGETELQEWTYIRKDGSGLPVLLSVTGIFNDGGRLIGFLGIASDITDQKAKERVIAGALAEKEVLLREIHHRVKNNLQVISSLLQLQAGCVEDDVARKVFEESQGRIKSMALVHEKLYLSNDLSHIDFGAYVRDLVAGLIESHGGRTAGVVIEVQAASVPLDVDRAIPCGLIVNELVSNCFKHGFPNARAGRIDVILSGGGSASSIQLIVRDDGVGWPADFNPAQTSSLGLRLVHILARQIQGSLHLQNDSGISCTLILDSGHHRGHEGT